MKYVHVLLYIENVFCLVGHMNKSKYICFIFNWILFHWFCISLLMAPFVFNQYTILCRCMRIGIELFFLLNINNRNLVNITVLRATSTGQSRNRLRHITVGPYYKSECFIACLWKFRKSGRRNGAGWRGVKNNRRF